MIGAHKYSWFLPKAYSWLSKLIAPDKLKEIEAAKDLKGFLNALKGTRLSAYVLYTPSPLVIDVSIRKFYKNEIKTLLSIVPEQDVIYLKNSLLPTFVRELFFILTNYPQRDVKWLQAYKDSFITIDPSVVEKLISSPPPPAFQTMRALEEVLNLIEDIHYKSFMMEDEIHKTEQNDIPAIESYYYLKALNRVIEGLPRNAYAVDPKEVVCPYVDLEAIRTISFYLVNRGSFPEYILKLCPIGCYGFELADLSFSEKKVKELYLKLSEHYKVTLDINKEIYEIDKELGKKLKEKVQKYSRKAFASYPFSVSVPLGLLYLLLGEKDFLLSTLSKLVFVS